MIGFDKTILIKTRHLATPLAVINNRYYSSENDLYLHKSKIPTMHFQPSLPRLPIPPLEKTGQRYLNALTPLLDDEALNHTKKLFADFEAKSGRELNQQLIEQDKLNKSTSYISAPWFDMYLKDRQPIVLNYNPFLSFVEDKRDGYMDQTVRAANFLISAIRFRHTLSSGKMEPEVYHLNPKKSDTEMFRTVTSLLPSSVSWYGAYLYKAYPLDMSQYNKLFNSTRIPEIGKDRLYTDTSANHILVMRRGHFYKFDVMDKEGEMLQPGEIYACLDYIQKDDIGASEHPLGYLTSDNRDVWASVRQLLVQDNGEQLEAIDSALFNLVLDDVSVGDDRQKISKVFLHGDGSNRWFDKSFSLIVAADGNAAVNFEHSWGDGVAVMRFFNEVLKDSTEKARVIPHSSATKSRIDPSHHVTRLDFHVNDGVKAAVDKARQQFDVNTATLNIDVFASELFGKKLCKQQKVSPDAMMQLGFQMAYHLQNGTNCATYESCSTAAFKHGRTETMRPCTTKTKAFCEAISSTSSRVSHAELRALISQCSDAHNQLTREAAMGEGFDRHLFALKYLSEERGQPLPSLYHDDAYAAINHNVLSTSTLSSPAVYCGGFAPVVSNGYGLGYSIDESMLGAVVSTYHPHRSGSDFVSCLQSAFQQIHDVLRK